MARYAREEIISSSDVVRNFGAVLNSVVQHRREKVAIVRNNRLEAVLVAADVYERLTISDSGQPAAEGAGNAAAILHFLTTSRCAPEARMSSDEIDRQILTEREAWD